MMIVGIMLTEKKIAKASRVTVCAWDFGSEDILDLPNSDKEGFAATW